MSSEDSLCGETVGGDASSTCDVEDSSVSIPSDLSLGSLDLDDNEDQSDEPASDSSEEADDESESISSDQSRVDEESSDESWANEESSDESGSNEESRTESGVYESDGNNTEENSDNEEESDQEKELDLSFVTDMSSDCSAEELPVIKRRAKRGGFKKGFLKRTKSRRSEHQGKLERGAETGSGHQSEGYTDEMEGLLPSEPDAGGDDSCYCSVAETVPSEGDRDTEADKDNEPERISPQSTKRKRKKKKTVGRKRKYQWKQSNILPGSPADNSLDDTTTASAEITDTATDATATTYLNEEASSSKQGELSPPPAQDAKDRVKSELQNLTDQQPQPHESLKLISNYLKLTLDDSWEVSVADKVLCICNIARPANPVVERSITWDGSNINFLVHNLELPARNILWQLKKPDIQNFGDVADFLTKVSTRFLSYEICAAVQSHSHLWTAYSELGHSLDKNCDAPSLRSSNCRLILLYPGKCISCRQLETTLREKARQTLRTASAKGGGDQSKINNRYLQKQDLENKLSKVQAENKMQKRTIRRLRKRIELILKKHTEKISSGLSKDFIKIMDDNVDKMSGIEKIFWEQQSKALSKRGRSKSMRWHPSMIRLALHLRSLSPAAYDFVRGFISLPSQRRLYDYSQFTNIQEGISADIQADFKKMIDENCSDDSSKYFIAMLDEMTIRSDLVYSSRTGKLVGYTNLTSLEEELSQLEAEIQGNPAERKLAKKVLVFMLCGAANPIRFVAAVYSTDDLTASQLFIRAWEVIYFAEDAGAKVLAVIFDGASVNRKFIQMHFNAGDKDYIHCTLNPASGDLRPLFFMLDTPHLLKTFRNCFANSHCHRKSRNLILNDQEISWKAIEALYEILQKLKFKCTKLTKAHVYLTNFSCMKVYLAVQVLSRAVAEALQKYKDMSPLKEHYSEELVKFILMMNRCFDCLNGGEDSAKKEKNPDLLEYTSISDPRFDFLEFEFIKYLEDWETYVKNKEGSYTKDQRSRMTISYQSLEGMKITISSFVKMTRFLIEKGAPIVSARRFGQDPLEQFFAELRRARGSDNNPTLKQVMHTRLVYHALGQQLPAAARKGNTESFKRAFEPDESPLPVRKKVKKV